MAKAVRVQDEQLRRALETGVDYLIIDNRRFLLVEVTDQGEGDHYDVTDPEELKAVDEALQETSRTLRGAEARAYLDARLKEHGVR
ncbi:MAG TPA: hypothetical protein VK191_16735 [Symbiobacteriaceae bacterium]|nr:hypothetical protein [Symbiobacteriaceae bacterium]